MVKEFYPFEYSDEAAAWLAKNCAKCSKAQPTRAGVKGPCKLLDDLCQAIFFLGPVKLEVAQKVGYRKKTGGWMLNAMCRRFYPTK